MIENEATNVRPIWTDLIPLYGGVNYVRRTTYGILEEPQLISGIARATLTLAQIIYNGYVVAELLNLSEGKPTLTQRIFEIMG